MIEEWRPISGYEGLYEVSSFGRVRSLRKNIILRPKKEPKGYLRCNLYLNKNMKTVSIHRLVAQAFIPNPDNLREVNHKDEDKTNNIVDNLEWCDRKYNNNYGTRKDKVRESQLKSGYWKCLSKKEYNHRYYQENKDKAKEYYKKYYQENKDKICDRQKEYWRKKKERIQNND